MPYPLTALRLGRRDAATLFDRYRALSLPYTAYELTSTRATPCCWRRSVQACISSPFGPRVPPNHPRAGTYHYGVQFRRLRPVRRCAPPRLAR